MGWAAFLFAQRTFATGIHRFNEVILALLALFWGVILMLPGDLFAGLERYKYFSDFFADWGWGLAMVICALATVLRLSVWSHKYAHVGLCIIWSGMAALSISATLSPPALLIASLCAAIALLHASKYWRLQAVA
jgi:hypothetical protein